MEKDLRIIFMGTPDFAVGVLKALVAAKKNIIAVITAPDKPAGRGRKLHPSAVKEYAITQGLDVLQPTNLNSEAFVKQLQSYYANLQIVVAFRMLPKVVWAMPAYGTFNLHASLLPQYRGAAPINWAIINGEKTTGVTTFFIDEKIDTGAIIAKREVPIAPTETVGTLHDTLMNLGATLVIETVGLIARDKATPQLQPKDVTLKQAPKLTTQNTRVDWNLPGVQIEAFIRGLSPFPVAWTILHNNEEALKTKCYLGHFEKATHKHPSGKVITSKKELKIATNDGYIYMTEIQLPGKRKMDIVSLLNGFEIEENAKMV